MFALSWKGKLTASVQVHQREAFTFPLWIIYSDSEYGLLLPIQIPDSYTLNVAVNETLASQNSRVEMVGLSGDNRLRTICGLEEGLLLIQNS
ncbi:hypothetical protein D4R42_04580 [bacterium]|nr:MAG: hypothetical protein D4R42_04580 [bacterium]